MEIPITYFLYLSAAIFSIGLAGIFLNRKNLIILLMSIELILLSANINFVAFSTFYENIVGQIFVFFGIAKVWLFRFVGPYISGILEFRSFGFLDFWIVGCLDFWNFGFLALGNMGHVRYIDTHIYMYIYTHIYI